MQGQRAFWRKGRAGIVASFPFAQYIPSPKDQHAEIPAQNLHQMHRDMIVELPTGTENLGSTAVCKIQGMYAPKRLITVQGHPEFTSEIVRELLETRKRAGIFPEEMFQEMMGRVDNKHDGLAVSMAFLNFLEE